MVSVHLGYVTGAFHAMLDGDLDLPQNWAEDAARRAVTRIRAAKAHLLMPSGRTLKKPWVAEDQREACQVGNLWQRGGPSWQDYRIKDTDKGPVVWEVRESPFFPNDHGVPGAPLRLIVVRNVLDGEVGISSPTHPQKNR